MKDYFSNNFKSLLNGLLDKNEKTRLSLSDAKQHPFFKGVNWFEVLQCSLKAPIDPKVIEADDLKNIDKQVKNINFLDA